MNIYMILNLGIFPYHRYIVVTTNNVNVKKLNNPNAVFVVKSNKL